MVLECDSCRSICSHQICFVLKPCNHVTCVKCFHQAVPASYAMQCPCSGCQRWVESSVLLEVNDKVESKEQGPTSERKDEDLDLLTQTSPLQEVIHFEPDEQMDPFRHWAMKKPNIYSGFLYVAFRCNNEEASFYRANFKAANSSVFMDDDSSDDLVKIFARVLHPLLFRKDFFKNEENNVPTISSQDSIAEYSLPTPTFQERQHLALTSLYALSSGRVMSQEEQAEISQENLARHGNIKQKAIECAKGLAKELLLSRRKSEHVSTPTGKRQNRKSRKRQAVLSPIIENQARDSFTVPPLDIDDDEPVAQPKAAIDLSEAQVPYLLGFLLFGAAWMVSN